MNPTRYCTGWPIAALVASVIGAPSHAADLTLDEALRLAEDNAPSLAAQTYKLQAASSAAIPAGELPDPKLILGVQNYPVSGPDRWMLKEDFMTMQMVGVMQEMPNGDKRRARSEVANAAVDRAAADGRIERLKVRQGTAEAWITRYSVERKQALFGELFRENRLLATTVNAQIAGGRAQSADAVTAKQEAAQLAEQEDELVRQQAEARAALRRWIGPAADEPLVGELPAWPIAASEYAGKLERNPELAAYAHITGEAEAKVREAEADKKPDWSWEVDYQRRAREFGDMVSVEFTFDLPLFPGSRQNPTIAARRAELNQLEAEREARTRESAQQLEADLAEYERLNRSVRRSQDSLLPLAKEKVDLTTASYRAGTGDLSAVIAARRELIEARLNHIDIEGQRALTGAKLHFTYGESHQ
ncbi:TolC family protein [Pseudomonas aeruginosa]|nr:MULTISPECIES: TolC family protein [Pseudomonas]RUJ25484.1 TolC family protein [Pseudomonas aeruginosa]RUJ43527.1 TolC family protein [Pseudomonas aeruginosa]UCP01029.1 TolC family protein [Pseudomonas lalkuanensis]WAG81854.1 TolC family protein [Pseudomonas furukawaii]